MTNPCAAPLILTWREQGTGCIFLPFRCAGMCGDLITFPIRACRHHIQYAAVDPSKGGVIKKRCIAPLATDSAAYSSRNFSVGTVKIANELFAEYAVRLNKESKV